jgi:hypothetical protein
MLDEKFTFVFASSASSSAASSRPFKKPNNLFQNLTMTKKTSSTQRKIQTVDSTEEDLDRFAGSSDDEGERHEGESDEDHVPDDDEYHGEQEDDQDEVENDKEDGENDDTEEEEEEDEDHRKGDGMANAMARILGTSTTKQSVVLSKTITPLQRMALKEKEELQQQREKRLANRERHLTAFHIPLSVATSRTVNASGGTLAQELERERTHRRVATRGVVALFNAIAQHQQTSKMENPFKSDSAKNVQNMTKASFLDLIKAGGSKHPTEEVPKKPQQAPDREPKWNALQDDFMLKPKRDWDQESSEEEEEGVVDDDWSDGEESPKKRQKVATQ